MNSFFNRNRYITDKSIGNSWLSGEKVRQNWKGNLSRFPADCVDGRSGRCGDGVPERGPISGHHGAWDVKNVSQGTGRSLQRSGTYAGTSWGLVEDSFKSTAVHDETQEHLQLSACHQRYRKRVHRQVEALVDFGWIYHFLILTGFVWFGKKMTKWNQTSSTICTAGLWNVRI